MLSPGAQLRRTIDRGRRLAIHGPGVTFWSYACMVLFRAWLIERARSRRHKAERDAQESNACDLLTMFRARSVEAIKLEKERDVARERAEEYRDALLAVDDELAGGSVFPWEATNDD